MINGTTIPSDVYLVALRHNKNLTCLRNTVLNQEIKVQEYVLVNEHLSGEKKI